MGFYEILRRCKKEFHPGDLNRITVRDVERALCVKNKGPEELFCLLSPAAECRLEEMAEIAHELTLRFFGRAIRLYTPLYLSDFCENRCLYCGFSARNKFERKRLSIDELTQEAEIISATGLKHILILTGDSRRNSPVDYIRDCLQVLRHYFSSISIEVYPCSKEEYAGLVKEGVDGLTIYQETYDEQVYEKVHPAGPKRDYHFRLDAPERGALGGISNINTGVLLGLADWRQDVFFLGMHAKYLLDNFPDIEIGISVPRLRPHEGDFEIAHQVSDKNLVQIILAMRLFLPRMGISLSTREDMRLRESLLPLGITRMSAGSNTAVGGHIASASRHSPEGNIQVENDIRNPGQFEIADRSTVAEVASMIREKGYDPVFKDWTPLI